MDTALGCCWDRLAILTVACILQISPITSERRGVRNVEIEHDLVVKESLASDMWIFRFVYASPQSNLRVTSTAAIFYFA